MSLRLCVAGALRFRSYKTQLAQRFLGKNDQASRHTPEEAQMIRRTFLQAIALSAGTLAGWLKGTQNVSALPKCVSFDCVGFDSLSGWTVTHRIDNVGRHVIQSTKRFKGPFPYWTKVDAPALVSGFCRKRTVFEDIYKRHCDVCITDLEISRVRYVGTSVPCTFQPIPGRQRSK